MRALAIFSIVVLVAHGELRAEAPLAPSQPSGHQAAPAATVLLNGEIPASAQEAAAQAAAERAGLSGPEVMARLVFSEALATGYWHKSCEWKSDEDLLRAIAWGVGLRVRQARAKLELKDRATARAFYDVVFARGQFRTSFTPKTPDGKPNKFAQAFLAPEKAQDYLNEGGAKSKAADLLDLSRKVVEQVVAAQQVPAPFASVTNFFYPYSEVFGSKRPKWAPYHEAAKNPGFLRVFTGSRPCVEFYNLKGQRH